MKVLKFGGTSVGSVERIKHVADLVTDGEKKIVVLSAMSGTTNSLVEISEYLEKKNYETANESIYKLHVKYNEVVDGLFANAKEKEEIKKIINGIFKEIEDVVGKPFDKTKENLILAQGEMLSTNIFTYYQKSVGRNCELIPALDYMKTNQNAEPDNNFIREKLNIILEKYEDVEIIVTQGFICKNINGDIDNLQRGGSDYTASIIGAQINADEIQIWTDIDGMHNNDPRIVEKTHSIKQLSFDEAAELAYFGAKILHPTSVLPAKYAKIPVILKNTMDPKAPGTTISSQNTESGLKAVAAKDGITMIQIKSGRMLLAYGFLRKIFEIFEKYKTPIDMITTSEVGVSLTIDKTKYLNNIVEEIKEYGSVDIIENQCIICMVGYLLGEDGAVVSKIFDALKDINKNMISYGGSKHNISVLVGAEDKKNALIAINDNVF